MGTAIRVNNGRPTVAFLCDMCPPEYRTAAVWDSPVPSRGGRWAMLCQECWEAYGVGPLLAVPLAAPEGDAGPGCPVCAEVGVDCPGCGCPVCEMGADQ